MKITEQQYEAAKANYNLFEEKSHTENIELSKAQLDQAKAAYDIVQNSLNNMSVMSPLNGTISAKNIKAGEFISNATVAFVIIDDSSYTIDINVSEDTIGKVHAGDTAKVYINSIL
ncbi:MAG: HlyD family efflux transporter periplasmic adaptor subunit [Clostridiales bacterium]|nr:HlyD family efflux transporter periplasmic adaptor subunit [Clostridiales bacterium]